MKQCHIDLLTTDPVEIKDMFFILDGFYKNRKDYFPKGEPLQIKWQNEDLIEYVLSHDVFRTDKAFWFIGGERFAVDGVLTDDCFGVKAIACYSSNPDKMLEGLIKQNIPDETLHIVNVNFDALDAPAACYFAANIQTLLSNNKLERFSCAQKIVLSKAGEPKVTLNLLLSSPLVPRKSAKYLDQDRYAIIKSHIADGGYSMVNHNPETLRIIDGRFKKTSIPRVKHEKVFASHEKMLEEDSLLSRISFLKSKPSFFVQAQRPLAFNVIRFERLMQGRSLEDWLIEGIVSWPLDLRCRLAIATLHSLKRQVHDLSIIHMDIKPGNLMFCLDNKADPEVNVIDFNLSRDRAKASKPNNIVGTYLYFAPEVWSNDTPNEARDIFALGVTFGELFGAILSASGLGAALKLSENYQFNRLFTGLETTPDAIKAEIISILMSMTNPSAEDRPKLLDLVASFEGILAKLNLVTLPEENQRSVNMTI